MNNWGVALLGLRSGAPSRDAMGFLYSPLWVASAHFGPESEDDRALVGRVRAKNCVPAREGPPAYLPRMAIGKNKKLSKGRKGGKKKLCARPPPPLNRFLSLLRPPPAPALSSSMTSLTRVHGGARSVDPFSRKEWYDVKAPSIFAVRNAAKTCVNRTQGTSTPPRPPPPSARYRGWLSSESSPRSRIAFVSDV